MPENSVSQPATISLSASGRSNGILSSSASIAIKKTIAPIGKNIIHQNVYWDSTISLRFSVPVSITTPKTDKISGISNETIWCSARIPPMNGNLLFADHADNTVMTGKNPIIAKTANSPTSASATTHPPRAAGIRETNAAAVPTNNTGAAQKIGLSALAGIMISLDNSLIPSLINCKIPSIFPQ